MKDYTTIARRPLRMIAVGTALVLVSTVALLGTTQEQASAFSCPSGTTQRGTTCVKWVTKYTCASPSHILDDARCYTKFWGKWGSYAATPHREEQFFTPNPCPPKTEPKKPKYDRPSSGYVMFASYAWPPGYNFGFV